MSININKYSSNDAYQLDETRPASESCVSQIGTAVKYEGKNIVLEARQLGKYDVCLTLKDNVDGKIKYMPVETYSADTFDSTRYTIKPFVRYAESDGYDMHVYKSNTASTIWADYNRYKIACDLTASGGFTWSVVINGTTKTGSVSWSAGDTLDDIVAQMTSISYLTFSHENGEDFIRVLKGGYSVSTFTLTVTSGTATLTDLSLQMKIDGVLQDTSTHREWQSVDASTYVPGVMAASATQYARNGYNKQHRCGVNFARFKAYFTTSGSATYVTENGIGIMTKTAFDNCGTSQTAAEKELYNKYNGDYDLYLEGQMVQVDDTHRSGMEYKTYSNAKKQTDLLASVTTLDFDGSWVHPYLAAYAASQITDADLGNCSMQSNHDIAVCMEDSQFALINRGIEIIGGGTKLSITGYYWSVAQYIGGNAWLYYGNFGALSNSDKYGTCSVRPVLASVRAI